MANRFTRRQIAAALAATPALAQAPTRPQAPPQPPGQPAPQAQMPADPLERARLQARRNGEALAKVQVGMAVEPSFAFKP